MYRMTDEEFYEVYGRMPRRNPHKKKKKIKIYWHRIIIALIILILIVFGIVKLVKLIVGKVKNSNEETGSVSVSSAVDDSKDDYYAEPDNKEADSEYHGIELTVCIDPAHGGFDKGTEADDGRCEKDDTLKIALDLKDYLESCGVNVIMTRNDDSYIKVEERCQMANEQKADLFVSIHRDITYYPNGDIHGIEAWIHNSLPETDKVFAQKIMNKLEEIGISENKGVHGGYPDNKGVNYDVNQLTEMPSVLLNMGFVSSSIDNQLLDANLEAYSRAIGNGIIETAKDLGVIDEKGTRLESAQLISNKPKAEVQQPVVTKESDESRPDDSSQEEVTDYDNYNSENEKEQETQDGQENTQQSDEDYVYTDDGMGYYTEPMMTE